MPELILLSIIQGITEFIPVSSSAHLILAAKYFNTNNNNLTLDISLHLGSLLAIVIFYLKDLKNFIKLKDLLKKILVTTIPITIFGFFLIKSNFIDFLRSYEVIGWSTVIFGIFLFLTDLREREKKFETGFNYKDAIFIGFFQILALIPGVSRSGITITSARWLKYNRIDSAKISFFTSIPILIIASVYNLIKISTQDSVVISTNNLIGVFLSFVFSYLTIKLFLSFLKKFNLFFFSIYRIILGSIILFYVYV